MENPADTTCADGASRLASGAASALLGAGVAAFADVVLGRIAVARGRNPAGEVALQTRSGFIDVAIVVLEITLVEVLSEQLAGERHAAS